MEVVQCTGGRYPIGMCCAGHACGKGEQMQGGASACCRAARGSSIEVRQCGGDLGSRQCMQALRTWGLVSSGKVNIRVMQERHSCCASRQRVV